MIALLLLCARSSKSVMDKVAGWKSWGRRPSAPEVPTRSKPFMVSSTMVWLGNCISANISFKTSNLFPLRIFCLCFGKLSWSFFSSASSCIALVVHFFKKAALSLATAAGNFCDIFLDGFFHSICAAIKNACWVSSLQGFLDEALDSPWAPIAISHNWLSSPFLSIAFCIMRKTRPLAGKETPSMTTSSLSLAPTLTGGALEMMLTTTWLHSGMKAKDFLAWFYAKALARWSGWAGSAVRGWMYSGLMKSCTNCAQRLLMGIQLHRPWQNPKGPFPMVSAHAGWCTQPQVPANTPNHLL